MSQHISKKKLQQDKTHPKAGVKKLGGGQGCVTKCVATKWQKDHHGSYRYNGYEETKNDTAKSALYQPSAARLKTFVRGPELQIGRGSMRRKPKDPSTGDGWRFKGKNYVNNSNVPFAHNHHHILPWDALKSGVFNQDELKLLQKSGYNVNAGFNVIILPCREPVAKVLRMYTHPNNHPNYNIEVALTINSAKFVVAGGDPKVHLTEESAKDLRSIFEAWAKSEYWVLVAGGKLRCPEHVDVHQPSDMFEAWLAS